MADASAALPGCLPPVSPREHRGAVTRIVLTIVAVLFLAFFLLLPLISVFFEAFRGGLGAYFAAITDRDARSAIELTLLIAAISVPANLVFGLAASWAIAKFSFKGKSFLITLIDLPFSVSPVTSGLIYVLLFGAQGFFGPGCRARASRSSSRCPASCWRRSS